MLTSLFLGAVALLQGAPPRLAFHLPEADSVRVVAGQVYRNGSTGPLRYDLYLPHAPGSRSRPVILLFNGGTGTMRGNAHMVAWARLLAGVGLAAVVWDSDATGGVANFDSLSVALADVANAHQLDMSSIGVWAASANVVTALPMVSDSTRTNIRAAVMYYGFAPVTGFRTDLPLQIVRVGLDQIGLLRMQDSLIARALAANAPVEILNHPSGEHPFEMTNTRAAAAVVEATVAFLHHKLHPQFDGALIENELQATAGAAAYAGDWSRAAAAFRDLALAEPDNFELQRRLGEALVNAGDYDAGIAALIRSREMGHWRRGDIAIALIAAYAHADRREDAWREVAGLPAQWDKAAILRLNPVLAPFRDDPEFIERMR